MAPKGVKRGDLIEVNRNGIWPYHHWLLCESVGDTIDDVWCFHVAPRTGSDSCMFSSSNRNAVIKYQALGEVLGGSTWQINNQTATAKKKLKASGRKAPDLDRVFRGLHRRVNSDDPADYQVTYKVINHNCEHWVTKWKYGIAFSGQGDKTRETTNDILSYFNPIAYFN